MENLANSTGVRVGLICGLSSIIANVIIYLTGLYVYYFLSLIVFMIPVIGVLVAHISYRKEGNGYLNYWTAVRMGTIVGTINSWISAIIGHFYLTYIDSTPLVYSLEKQRQDLYEKGLSEETIKQSMENAPSPATTVVIGLFAAVVVSLIIAMLISSFTKRQEPMAPVQDL